MINKPEGYLCSEQADALQIVEDQRVSDPTAYTDCVGQILEDGQYINT